MLKPIFIGFLLGFSLMGVSRLSSATPASAVSLSSTGLSQSRHRGAAFDRVSLRRDCDRPFARVHPLI